MNRFRLAAFVFVLAALAWFYAAAMLPTVRLPYVALGLLNLGLAALYLRRDRAQRTRESSRRDPNGPSGVQRG